MINRKDPDASLRSLERVVRRWGVVGVDENVLKVSGSVDPCVADTPLQRNATGKVV
jgi:hypothetical protein